MKHNEMHSSELEEIIFDSQLTLRDMLFNKIQNEFDKTEASELIDLIELFQSMNEKLTERTGKLKVKETMKSIRK